MLQGRRADSLKYYRDDGCSAVPLGAAQHEAAQYSKLQSTAFSMDFMQYMLTYYIRYKTVRLRHFQSLRRSSAFMRYLPRVYCGVSKIVFIGMRW